MRSWPDNTLTYLHGTGAVSIPLNGRLTGYAAFGQGRNSTDLLPHTINTAFAPPPPLSRTTAEAESQMAIAQFTAGDASGVAASSSTRATATTTSTSRRRCSTARAAPCRYDTNLRVRLAVGVPQRQALDVRRRRRVLGCAVHVAEGRLQPAGHRLHAPHLGNDRRRRVPGVARHHRQPALHAARAVREPPARPATASKPDALAEVGELPTMRHFDIADRDRNRFTFIGYRQRSTSIIELNASAGVGRDEYPDSQHGLQSFDSDQSSVGASIAPDDRYNLTASYGWENYKSHAALAQRQRRGPAGRPATRLDHGLHRQGELLRGRLRHQRDRADDDSASAATGTSRTTPISMGWSPVRRWPCPSSCRR